MSRPVGSAQAGPETVRPRAAWPPGGDPSAAGVAALALLLIALVGPPLVLLFTQSFTPPAGLGAAPSLAPYAALFTDLDLPRLAANTLLFATATTVATMCLVVPMAWLVERTDARFRTLVYGATLFAFSVPPLVYLAGWTLLLARSGPVNSLLQLVSDARVTPYSFEGLVLLEALVWAPLGFLLLSASFRLMNPELEEAASANGARMWATLRRVTFPLIAPAVAALGLLVFIRTIEAFEIPALLGTPARFPVLTVRIYDLAKGQTTPDYSSASAFSVLLIAALAGLLYLYGRLTRDARRFQTVSGRGFRPRMIELGPLRGLASAINLLYVLIVAVLPIAIIIWASFLPFYQHPSAEAFQRLTTRNYGTVLGYAEVAAAARNSLVLGVAAATIVTVLTGLVAWAVIRTKVPGRLLLDQLTSIPLVLPGIVLGVAVLRLVLSLPIPILGTLYALILAQVIRLLPYGIRYGQAGLLQLHSELEEVAYVSGASWGTTIRRVVLPLLAPSLLAGWLFMFMSAMRELSSALMLYGTQSWVMSVVIFDMYRDARFGQLSALCLLWMLLLGPAMLAFYLLTRRYGLHAS